MASEKNWSGRNGSSSCIVCDAAEAKYKFRCCQKAFCSTDCFKRHSDCEISDAVGVSLPEQRIVRTSNFDLNLTDDEILTDATHDRVRRDPEILRLLTSPKLKSLLFRLNNSRDRRRTFKRMSSTSPLFANLIQRIESALSDCDD